MSMRQIDASKQKGLEFNLSWSLVLVSVVNRYYIFMHDSILIDDFNKT